MYNLLNMTNNLKILTILSIFVLILTGYFCFSSSFTKNQIIANNNKDNKEITNINNEDSNNNEEKDNEEKNSNLSILGIVIFIILIIIIAVIVFIIVNFSKSKFEFNEDSKEDFAKKNFCPLFFLIKPTLTGENNTNDVNENGEYFFKVLTERIFPKEEDEINNININGNVKIFLDAKPKYTKKTNINEHTGSLGWILNEINAFAAFTKNVADGDIEGIVNPLRFDNLPLPLQKHAAALEKKYGKDFDSYLCSYLLYYFAEEIENKNKNVKIQMPNNIDAIETKKTTDFIYNDDDNDIKVSKDYNLDYSVMNKILDKLFKDKPLKNVEYSKNL